MNDATILRMAAETVRHLGNAISVGPATYMVPSYNALVAAARANHRDDTFLKMLEPLDLSGDKHGETISIAEITALFAQLAIAVESLQK